MSFVDKLTNGAAVMLVQEFHPCVYVPHFALFYICYRYLSHLSWLPYLSIITGKTMERNGSQIVIGQTGVHAWESQNYVDHRLNCFVQMIATFYPVKLEFPLPNTWLIGWSFQDRFTCGAVKIHNHLQISGRASHIRSRTLNPNHSLTHS